MMCQNEFIAVCSYAGAQAVGAEQAQYEIQVDRHDGHRIHIPAFRSERRGVLSRRRAGGRARLGLARVARH